MSKNENLSLLDNDQNIHRMFDEKHDAQRVIIVGSEGKQIAESIKESLKDLKIEVKTEDYNNKEPLVLKIPYQTVIKELEIREIEKPVIITEIKIVEIEKPIIVTEVKMIEIEKPIIIKEASEIPKVFMWLFGMQVLISFISLVVILFQK